MIARSKKIPESILASQTLPQEEQQQAMALAEIIVRAVGVHGKAGRIALALAADFFNDHDKLYPPKK